MTVPTGSPVVFAVNWMEDPLHTVTSDAVTATLGVFTVTVTVALEVAEHSTLFRVCVAVAVTVYWRPLYADVAWSTTVTFGLLLACVGPKPSPLHE